MPLGGLGWRREGEGVSAFLIRVFLSKIALLWPLHGNGCCMTDTASISKMPLSASVLAKELSTYASLHARKAVRLPSLRRAR